MCRHDRSVQSDVLNQLDPTHMKGWETVYQNTIYDDFFFVKIECCLILDVWIGKKVISMMVSFTDT